MGRIRVGVVAIIAALAAPAAAQADPTVSVTPVTGPQFVVRTNAPESDARTDSRTPSFLVTSDTAGTLSCEVTTPGTDTTGSCGQPVTPCPTAECVRYTPTLPGAGKGDEEYLRATLSDADGNPLASGGYGFTFDLTPPNTQGGSDSDAGSQNNPLRPQFAVSIDDDDLNFNTVPGADTMQCSFVRAGRAASWKSCPVDNRGDATYTALRLADRHLDYTFSARSIDDLGRLDPTPLTVLYDPVPCALSVGHVSARSLIHSPNLSVKLQCTAVTQTELTVFVLQGYGGRRISTRSAIENGSAITDKPIRLRLRSGHATVRTKLNVGSAYGTYFRHYRTVSLLVVAGDVGDVSPTNSLVALNIRR